MQALPEVHMLQVPSGKGRAHVEGLIYREDAQLLDDTFTPKVDEIASRTGLLDSALFRSFMHLFIPLLPF